MRAGLVCIKPFMHIMSNELTSARRTRREHTDEFKRSLVDRSLLPGASVSSIALEAGINANLLFAWRRQLLRSTAASVPAVASVLLPVTVERTEQPAAAAPSLPSRSSSGSIEIELAGARVRVRGHVAAEDLRSVLQALRSLT